MIAEGANRYRTPGALERLARRMSRVSMSRGLRSSLKRVYLGLLRAQTRGEGLVATLPGGEQVRVLPEYSYLCWNPDEYRAFRAAVSAGGVALDIGANAGAYTLLLARWVGSTGAVFAFEPARAVFDSLVQHVRINGVGDTVTALCMAVGEHDGEAPLALSPTSGESRLAAPAERGQHIMVPTTTIDAFCEQRRIAPHFIKIDIEGWELAALRGARRTIRSRGRSLALFVELHPSVWPKLAVTRAMIQAELDEQGLELLPIEGVDDPWNTEGVCVRLRAR